MAVLEEVRCRQGNFSHVEFCHEGRKSNTDAHNLARLACSLSSGRHVWMLGPPCIIDVQANV